MDADRHVPVAALPDGDARRLLAELIGPARVTADRASAAELMRLCANLPLALTIVGARLANRPGWPIDVLVRQLSDERHRLDAPQDAATLLGVSAAHAWRALEHLLDVHLVEAVPPDRYRAPDLLRQYAAELAPRRARESRGTGLPLSDRRLRSPAEGGNAAATFPAYPEKYVDYRSPRMSPAYSPSHVSGLRKWVS